MNIKTKYNVKFSSSPVFTVTFAVSIVFLLTVAFELSVLDAFTLESLLATFLSLEELSLLSTLGSTEAASEMIIFVGILPSL